MPLIAIRVAIERLSVAVQQTLSALRRRAVEQNRTI
jgi:hypothetical protein